MAEIKLEFPVSRAVIYPAVIRLTSQLSGFTEAVSPQKMNVLLLDSNILDTKTITKLIKLWDMAKPLKGTSLKIDGRILRKGEESILAAVVTCMKERDYAEDPEAYCNGLERKPAHFFGCRKLQGVSTYHKIPNGVKSMWSHDKMMDPDSESWKNKGEIPFSLFSTQTETGWIVDTTRVKVSLRKWAEGRACGVCPHFSWERVERAVDLKGITTSAVFNGMTTKEIFGTDLSS